MSSASLKGTKAPELKPIGQVEAMDSLKEVKNQPMKVDWLFHAHILPPMIDAIQELNEFVGGILISLVSYKELKVTWSEY
ncbi:hypothetical protein [Vibrio coralliilyticus]|uniref:hypothetical protein n=1 Tax=Vibrio coralliilyticus TaxID=190893 RepID=UPI001C11E12E